MIEIPGRRQDHLIACTSQRGDGGGEGLIAAGSHGDVACADLRPIQICCVRSNLRPQRRVAEHVAIKVSRGFRKDCVGHDFAQTQRGRVGGGGLREVDKRPLRRKFDAIQPSGGRHDRRGEGGFKGRIEGRGVHRSINGAGEKGARGAAGR